MNVYGAVALAPVKVISGAVAFRQTSALPLIVAVGSGLTVMVALEFVRLRRQALDEPSVTFSRVYTYVPTVPVGAVTVATVELPVVVNVCMAPPLI